MSIKAYVGRMGSGKTYEVVSVVILGALRQGRRVITNIAGIDYAAMVDLLVSEGVDADEVGHLVTVPHEKVSQPSFWLDERTNADIRSGALAVGSRVSEILPGDLVALDEIWRFWSGFNQKDADGGRRPAEVMNFMRMHRHFTHPDTGVSCDLAIITQDVMDISRQVRAVIEETYRMEKLTAVGSSKRYRVDVCQGGQSRRVLRQLQRAYDPKYFPLYSSHSGRKEGDAAAVEMNIDGRGNILNGVLFRVILPVGVLVLGVAVYGVYSFFNPKPPEDKAAKSANSTPVANSAPSAAVERSRPPGDESSRWRVVGWIDGGAMRVVLSDGERRRIIAPPAWKTTGLDVEAFLPSGEAVTPWSGASGSGFFAGKGEGGK